MLRKGEEGGWENCHWKKTFKTNCFARGQPTYVQHTYLRTLQLLDRIGLWADSVKIPLTRDNSTS